ncbi:MAG: preprotein translocase subunit SecG [Deltaproteobacteria bacterium]|nr:preprotein translocase subunit SecG [Deltaproteobacteria bacterium]
MYAFITAVHIIVCILLVSLVLLQQGKGADTGAVFGGGSNTLFGASGADNLLTKVTTGLATLFFLTSIYLAVGVRQPVTADDTSTLMKDLPKAAAKTTTDSNASAKDSAKEAATSSSDMVPEEIPTEDTAGAEDSAPMVEDQGAPVEEAQKPATAQN